MRNLTLMTKAFFIVASVAIVLVFVVFYLIQAKFPLPSDPDLRVKYLEQYVDIAQVLAVGIAVTLISVII